jgi:hypothetical protein
MNPYLDFLLSDLYSARGLHPDHLADLRASTLTDATIERQRIRTVPPAMIGQLLGFEAPKVMSAYLIPYADSRGGWMDHVRVKVFPTISTDDGKVKYLQRRLSGVRIFFPLATLPAVLHSTDTLYVVEGEKKGCAVAQLGHPTIAIAGIEGWHQAGARSLHPDFDDVGLRGRDVHVVPDADARTNPAVHAAVRRLGAALAGRGARPRLVHVPDGFKGVDDWLASR